MKHIGVICLFLIYYSGLTQEEIYEVFPEVDSLYREDQIYIGGTFHVITNRPEAIDQSGFSGGLDFGFIRDMPINKRRNLAFGLGLGYSLSSYNHNMYVQTLESTTSFREITDEDNLETNRFSIHTIEMPIQFRWRTSTATSYKFWRVYTGVQLGYMHYFKSTFEDDEGNRLRDTSPTGLERLRYGATVSFGWNTFNFYAYYGLNQLFSEDVEVIDQNGAFNVVKLGLIFYIL